MANMAMQRAEEVAADLAALRDGLAAWAGRIQVLEQRTSNPCPYCGRALSLDVHDECKRAAQDDWIGESPEVPPPPVCQCGHSGGYHGDGLGSRCFHSGCDCRMYQERETVTELPTPPAPDPVCPTCGHESHHLFYCKHPGCVCDETKKVSPAPAFDPVLLRIAQAYRALPHRFTDSDSDIRQDLTRAYRTYAGIPEHFHVASDMLTYGLEQS